jgi:hypothetical protein
VRVFDKKVLRIQFRRKRDEIIGGWRKIHNEELCKFYSSPNGIVMIKSRRTWWVRHVALNGEMRMASPLLRPSYAPRVVNTDSHGGLCAEGRVGENFCLMIIVTGAAVTDAQPGTVVGLPERAQSPKFALQMASSERPSLFWRKL